MKSPTQALALKVTATFGAAAVALGAFGAHGLEDFLIANGRLETWETAVFYHLALTPKKRRGPLERA